MEGTKPRTASTIGMFDLLKGVGMLMIVFAHTAELYPLGLFGSGGLSVSGFGLFIYREALMAAFYIASGYGFRQRSVGKCIQQQCKLILKPYFFTAVCTTALHFVIHYKTFGYMPGHLGGKQQGAGRLFAGSAPYGRVCGQGVFFQRANVVSAGADDGMDPAGHPVQCLSGAVSALCSGSDCCAGLGHLPCVGAALQHLAGHGDRALSVHWSSDQKNTAAGAPDPQMAGGRYPGQYIGSGAGRLGCRAAPTASLWGSGPWGR